MQNNPNNGRNTKHSSVAVTSSSGNELSLVQQGENLLIDARLLHQRLKVKTKFTTWFQRQINEYGFTEGLDFFPNLGKTPTKVGRPTDDFLLTIDMAKELAMVERTEVGRTIRRYFIQKEREARGVNAVLAPVSTLFKGLKPLKINGRELYPYREVLERCGYNRNANGSDRIQRYPGHFVKQGAVQHITREFALHLYHQRQVFANRASLKAQQPVLPLGFGEPIQIEGGKPC